MLVCEPSHRMAGLRRTDESRKFKDGKCLVYITNTILMPVAGIANQSHHSLLISHAVLKTVLHFCFPRSHLLVRVDM